MLNSRERLRSAHLRAADADEAMSRKLRITAPLRSA
jgi:hypothetical protein